MMQTLLALPVLASSVLLQSSPSTSFHLLCWTSLLSELLQTFTQFTFIYMYNLRLMIGCKPVTFQLQILTAHERPDAMH